MDKCELLKWINRQESNIDDDLFKETDGYEASRLNGWLECLGTIKDKLNEPEK